MSLILMFVLIVLDSVVPFVPGEAALLAHASTALAAGWPALIALAAFAALAAFLGDNLTYELGRRVGTTRFAWMRHPRVAGLLARTGERLERRGIGVIATARLLPGVRVAVSFVAGATRMSRGRFRVASALGAMLWAAYLLAIGSTIGALTGGSTLVVVIISMVLITAINQFAKRVGRRLRTAPAFQRLGWHGSRIMVRAAEFVNGSAEPALSPA